MSLAGRKSTFGCVMGCVAALGGPAAAQPPRYTVTPLGSLFGAETVPLAINNAGQIVGISRPHAFRYSNGVMVPLGWLPGHEESWAFDINDAGQAVGYSVLDEDYGPFRAIRWHNVVMTDLGTLGGLSAAAQGINSTGQIVGWSTPGSDRTLHAFLWNNGVMTDLGTLGGPESLALAINDQMHVVGHSDYQPFIWRDGYMFPLVTSPDFYGSPEDINNADQVVGWYYGPQQNRRAFLWENGVVQDLGTFGGPSSTAQDISSQGYIVGSASTTNGRGHAFLYRDGQMFDLSEYVPDEYREAMGGAYAINELGQITVTGDLDHNFISEAYLLTPVPEPATLALVALTIAVRSRRASRRRDDRIGRDRGSPDAQHPKATPN